MKRTIVFLALLLCIVGLTYSQLTVRTDGIVETGKSLHVGDTLTTKSLLFVEEDADIGGSADIGGDADIGGSVDIGGDADIGGDVNAIGSITSNSQIGVSSTGSPGSTIEITGGLNVTAYLRDYPSLKVGSIGTSSRQWNKIYGEYIYGNGVYLGSDFRLKENIKSLDGSLNKIKLMNPVKYDFKETEVVNDEKVKEYTEGINRHTKNRVGFIAQDLKAIYPEAVYYDSVIDQYYIDYISIIPLLVDALQIQQQTIETLMTDIEQLKSNTTLKMLSTSISTEVANNASLFQNSPNPFNENTTIEYILPEGTTNADIIIYDMTGKQLRRIPLTQDGASSVYVSGGEFDPGMFMYSMIVDGIIIDTKKMIVTN